MAIGRRQHNSTILPDGRVLVTGGSSGPGFSDLTGSATPAEVFDGQTWTMLPAAAVMRLYHSSALLLPDGRVIAAGGGEGAGLPNFQNNAEVYYPDYWFKPRPDMLGAPGEVAYDQPFALGSSATICPGHRHQGCVGHALLRSEPAVRRAPLPAHAGRRAGDGGLRWVGSPRALPALRARPEQRPLAGGHRAHSSVIVAARLGVLALVVVAARVGAGPRASASPAARVERRATMPARCTRRSARARQGSARSAVWRSRRSSPGPGRPRPPGQQAAAIELPETQEQSPVQAGRFLGSGVAPVHRRALAATVESPAWLDAQGGVTAVLFEDELRDLGREERGSFFAARAPGVALAVERAEAPPIHWRGSMWRVRFRFRSGGPPPGLRVGATGWVERPSAGPRVAGRALERGPAGGRRAPTCWRSLPTAAATAASQSPPGGWCPGTPS